MVTLLQIVFPVDSSANRDEKGHGEEDGERRSRGGRKETMVSITAAWQQCFNGRSGNDGSLGGCRGIRYIHALPG